jgi:hypothetical protein
MAIRAWLAVFAAAASWFRSRTERVGMSPVSSDWLLDLERQTIKGRDY